jgi:hypothetical protein
MGLGLAGNSSPRSHQMKGTHSVIVRQRFTHLRMTDAVLQSLHGVGEAGQKEPQNQNFPSRHPPGKEWSYVVPGCFRKHCSHVRLREATTGFILCNVEYYGEDRCPLLPVKESSTGKLITPKGRWKSVYFSEEIQLALQIGYKIRPIKGYSFKRKKIFHSYVDDLFNTRLLYKKSEKNTAIPALCKFLLNAKPPKRVVWVDFFPKAVPVTCKKSHLRMTHPLIHRLYNQKLQRKM